VIKQAFEKTSISSWHQTYKHETYYIDNIQVCVCVYPIMHKDKCMCMWIPTKIESLVLNEWLSLIKEKC